MSNDVSPQNVRLACLTEINVPCLFCVLYRPSFSGSFPPTYVALDVELLCICVVLLLLQLIAQLPRACQDGVVAGIEKLDVGFGAVCRAAGGHKGDGVVVYA